MMTIEQEFFEAFKPKYIYRYRVYMEYKNGQAIKYYWGKELLINVFSDKTYKKREHIKELKVCEVIRHNPPITPEIVLGLLEILNREYNILIIECMANSTKITACPAPEQDWGCDEAYYRVYVEEKDLRTAILKVCSDYNVAMSIQDQVKALFNEM